jgi:CRISPR/Cas system CSM-associated protein Csm3 (group 7 of RAMP superfamily)
MPKFCVDLSIVIETALSVGGAGTVGSLADKSLLRDGWNRPMLPASQVKGRLRHACESIARGLGISVCQPPKPETTCPHLALPGTSKENNRQYCPICEIFGSPAFRGRLRFRDLVYAPPTGDPAREGRLYTPREPLRPGVGLDRRRGVVQEKLLFLTETTQPGTGACFAREKAICGNVPGPGHALLVLMGLKQILNWGGAKSRGLGWGAVEYTSQLEGQPFTLESTEGREALRQLCTSK